MQRILNMGLFLLFTVPVLAQDESVLEPTQAPPKDEVKGYIPPNDGQRFHKVLLIPYNPIMHLSDADVDIVEYSGLPLKKVHAIFRTELNASLNQGLKKIYPLKDLMFEDFEDEEEDLQKIYASLDYKMEKTNPSYLNEEAREAHQHPLLAKLTSITKKEETQPDVVNTDGIASDAYAKYPEKDQEYLASHFNNDEILPYLAQKYQTDLFVVINEIEIKTNYVSCLDLARKQYEREIRVHFTIFDKEGKPVRGDVAVTVFPSNSNDVGEITSNNYPLITDYIAKTIPQPHETVEEKKEAHNKMIMKFQKKQERQQSRLY